MTHNSITLLVLSCFSSPLQTLRHGSGFCLDSQLWYFRASFVVKPVLYSTEEHRNRMIIFLVLFFSSLYGTIRPWLMRLISSSSNSQACTSLLKLTKGRQCLKVIWLHCLGKKLKMYMVHSVLVGELIHSKLTRTFSLI